MNGNKKRMFEKKTEAVFPPLLKERAGVR